MTPRTLSSSAGFTYIAALVMVVIMGIALSQAAGVWKTRMQREREVELLFRGTQIRDAMRRYYWPSPADRDKKPTQLPPNRNLKDLKDLLKDPNNAGTVRYLRKLYSDPMMKENGIEKDFAFIKDASQRIIGVASTSEAEPIKQANFGFDLDPADFTEKKKYSEWQFICTHWYTPGATGGASGPGVTSSPTKTSPR